MRKNQTMCSQHNRWYVDGFGCPDCQRDEEQERQTELLERQTELLEESSQTSLMPAEVAHTHQHKHTFGGLGIVVHVDATPDPESQLRMAIDELLAFVAVEQIKGQFYTFEEWMRKTYGPSEKTIAAACMKAISDELLLEWTKHDKIVLKVNIDHPTLRRLLPAKRSEHEFLRDLSRRIALLHGTHLPPEE